MSKQLGSLLLQSGIVDQEQLEQHLEQARKRNVPLWDIVLEEKQISEESLADAFSRWLRIPRVRMASVQIDPEALKGINEELARKHICIPVKVEGKSLVVAMANPSDFNALQDLQFACGMNVKPVVASRTEIIDSIEQYFSTEEKAEDFLENVADAIDFRIVNPEKEEGNDNTDLDAMDARGSAHLPPVVKMCNLVIRDAIKASASDIHIEATLNAVLVRFRVDGVLRDYMQIPKWLQNAVVSRLKILAKLDIAERRLPQDGRIKVQYQNRSVDMRVSTLPTHFGEKVVLRILGSATVPTLRDLGFGDAQLQIVDAALGQPQGLILVTGPTGSGKSTTLYACLQQKKSPEVNIITVEDPIEFQIGGINQVQVNVKAGLTFAASLRSILRQDPDVILVGEIRDKETAEISFHASATGHLVLSTLHTNGTLPTLGRLLDLGIEPVNITDSIAVIVAQRLARRLCQHCKEEYTPAAGLIERLRLNTEDMRFFRGRGCNECGRTGFSKRIAIVELLRITPTLKDLIHKHAPEAEMRKAAGLAGTRFLLEDAMDKVRQGLTTIEEIMRVVQVAADEITRCPKCESFINLDFSTCPYCMYELKHLCASCGQELKMEWRVCPYCNTRTSTQPALQAAAVPIESEPPRASAAAAAAAPAAAPAQERETKKKTRRDQSGIHEAAAAAPAPQSPAAGLKPVQSPAAPQTKRPRILIVDDDDGIKLIVKKALQQLPMDVEIMTASDGVEALEKMKEDPADMLVLDVMMPRMDGFTVCEKLRQDIRTTFVPILMLTANADESNRTKGYLVGADDYMNKPFNVPDLNARVTRLLRRTYGL
jgi:type IV pilus assembly protein PilB